MHDCLAARQSLLAGLFGERGNDDGFAFLKAMDDDGLGLGAQSDPHLAGDPAAVAHHVDHIVAIF